MTTPPSIPNRPLTVSELYERWQKTWSFELLAGSEGMESTIETSEINRPGLALAGFYDMFSSDRLQLIGLTECAFLRNLTHEERDRAIRRTLGFSIPAIILTSSEQAPQELLDICNERNIPLLRTSAITSTIASGLHRFLERRLAPSWTVHGVMLDVFGMGVLIQGKSGVGKSECGLELIERGHRLIADDVVVVRRVNNTILLAETSPNIGYHMELRGIGIIDIELLYGVRAVRDISKISLRVYMEPWDPNKDYERLGLEERTSLLFDCKVPEYVLPVEPGRNIAKLVEVAALMQRLEEQGINVAQEFNQRIIDCMRGKAPERTYTAIDRLHRARTDY